MEFRAVRGFMFKRQSPRIHEDTDVTIRFSRQTRPWLLRPPPVGGERKSPDGRAPEEDTAVSRFRLVRLVEVKPVFCAFCVRTRMLESVSSPTLVRTRTSSALLRRVSSEIVGDLTRPPCWQFSPFMKASAFTRKSRRAHNRGDPRKWFPQRSLRDATARRNPSDTRRRACCP